MKEGDTVYWDGYSDIEQGKAVYVNAKNVVVNYAQDSLAVKERREIFESRVKALMTRAERKTREGTAAMNEASKCTKLALELANKEELLPKAPNE